MSLFYRWVRHWRIWRYFVQYFPITLVKTAEMDPNKSYVMAAHPHGIFAFGLFGALGTEALNIAGAFPGILLRAATLPLQFWLPMSREIFAGIGLCSSSKASLEVLLRSSVLHDFAPFHVDLKCFFNCSHPKGVATAIVVGGASEALNYETDKITLVLNKRKGFIKLALRFGRDIVPIFVFGENYVYGQAPNPEGSRLRRFQNWFEKKFTFSPPIFYGRGIFQYTFGLLPHRRPLNVVVGKPIEVAKVENPTSDDILGLHSKYIETLKELYEKYNPIYGDPSVKLVVH